MFQNNDLTAPNYFDYFPELLLLKTQLQLHHLQRIRILFMLPQYSMDGLKHWGKFENMHLLSSFPLVSLISTILETNAYSSFITDSDN